MGSPLAKNNAFGLGSPSWNLSFPSGNLTAAEILAYLPHWLKSVDVIDRFITNGGKSYTIAAMINEFRHQPGDTVFRSNSAQIMMSYGMRRAGFTKWTVGIHSEFVRPNPDLKEADLNVKTFRAPRETHPKSAPAGQEGQSLKHNEEADPMEFKALARHVKKHPFGSDALDLARCVQYALAHPSEDWFFPNDFENLVNKLGGPAVVTHSHLDKQVFDRRDNYAFSSPVKPSTRKSTPTSKNQKRTPSIKRTGSGSIMPQSSKFVRRAVTTTSGSPLKRVVDVEGNVQLGGRRKSNRLANKASVNFCDYDSDATDQDLLESPPFSSYATPVKKRKISLLPQTPGTSSNDSDFVEDGFESDEEITEVEVVSDEEDLSPIMSARTRAAAHKARQIIRGISTSTQRNIEALEMQYQKEIPSSLSTPQKAQALPHPTSKPDIKVSSAIMSHARTVAMRPPMLLKAPILSASRLRVDASTIHLYAAVGCTSMYEMWASALSSTRFDGPRRHPPFRELYRLIEPLSDDVSDWAENIRWAKEQYRCFGSDTWTEYDYHLELITTHRRTVFWASEEAIRGGV